MKQLHLFLMSMCLLVLSFSSCVDSNYDLSKEIDATVAIGGDTLSMPFINSMKILLKDLINPDSIKSLAVDQNGYSIVIKDSVNADIQEVKVPVIDDIEKKPASITISFGGAPLQATQAVDNLQMASSTPLHSEVADTVQFEMSFEMPDEIKSADTFYLSGTSLTFSLKFENVPITGNKNMKVSIQIPEFFVSKDIADEDNCWIITKSLNSGTSNVEATIGIDALLLKDRPIEKNFKISEKITYKIEINLEEPGVPAEQIGDIIITPVITLKNIKIRELTGLFEIDVEETCDTIDFGKELSQFGDGTYLDVEPSIRFEVKTNLGIPLTFDGNLKAVDIVQNDSSLFTFTNNAASSALKFTDSNFWIAEKQAGMPAGYIFAEAPGLNDLVSKMPDQLRFLMNVTADKTHTHRYEVGADYALTACYDVNVPFAFGENARIVYVSDMDFSMDGIGQCLTDYLEIYGEANNSIPMDITITLIPVDKDKNEIAIDPVVFKAKAGQEDGSPVLSEISGKLYNKNNLLKNVQGFKLNAVFTSGSVFHGKQLKPDDCLELMLKMRAPGGLVMDSDKK